ncbi:MAG: hypothetical protein TREMPRED_005892 [Tremellales sp. Tagirdzhanova-0007]|nr:MAG: hypothetical protein TREMPRED_005892 [Tremellales sp. Tagirdzhanova-0007]
MNPHKMNKIDVSSMSEQDQKAFKMYGKVPAKNVLMKTQKDRKYFDSGDYMMSKAGVATAQALGTEVPTPERVARASPPVNGNSQSANLGSSPTGNIPAVSPGLGDLSSGLPSPSLGQHGGVGVGISPAATSEAVEVPGHKSHARRGSESNFGVRVSPPGTMRESGHPPSSFPIGYGGFGSSPVKTSNLGRRLDEEMEG